MRDESGSFQESTMEVTQTPQPTSKVSVTTQVPSSISSSPTSPINNLAASPTHSVANNISNIRLDHEYFKTFPPGYRFNPYDDELVIHYLRKKVNQKPLPRNKIIEVNLYQFNPETLAEEYKNYGEKEWYFFTPRDRKYKNGTRPSRSAGNGYWKATGADKEVKHNGTPVGFRKALVFYRGKPPRGDKTNWIMHEFRVNDPPRSKRNEDDMRLDDWVLCRVYQKSCDKPQLRNKQRGDEVSDSPSPNHAPHWGGCGFSNSGLDGGFSNSGSSGGNADTMSYLNPNPTISEENLQQSLLSALPDAPQLSYLPLDHYRFTNQQLLPLEPGFGTYASNEYTLPESSFTMDYGTPQILMQPSTSLHSPKTIGSSGYVNQYLYNDQVKSTEIQDNRNWSSFSTVPIVPSAGVSTLSPNVIQEQKPKRMGHASPTDFTGNNGLDS